MRRARIRVRAEASKAPAEPTRASTTVGFSGEFTHPPCACKGSETVSRTAEPISRSEDFFMLVLRLKVSLLGSAKSTHECKTHTKEVVGSGCSVLFLQDVPAPAQDVSLSRRLTNVALPPLPSICTSRAATIPLPQWPAPSRPDGCCPSHAFSPGSCLARIATQASMLSSDFSSARSAAST